VENGRTLRPVSHIVSRAARPDRRVVMLDLLRLLAAVQMIQGHTIDAVLDQAVRRGFTFELWTAARGLTAVAFLFVAGLSFHVATLARLERHRASRAAVRARFRRVALLLGLGYLLHLPLGAWATCLDAGHAGTVVDILQCMAVCLGVAELLALVLPGAHSVALVSGLLAALALWLAPGLQGTAVGGTWAPLAHYVSAAGGSPFPLLPWTAHFFAGVALGGALLDGVLGTRAARLSAAGLALLASSVVPASSLVADHLGRLGGVLLVAALLAVLEERVGRLPTRLERLAGATLTLYVVHIVLVYGDVVGLATVVGPTLSPAAAVGVAALVLVLSVLVVLGDPGRLPGRLAAGRAAG